MNFLSTIAEMNQHQHTYDWAKLTEPRFQFLSHTGPIMLYSESGEIVQPNDKEMVFSDGLLQFSDEMQTIIVKAHKRSKAVFLLEFRKIIVAALCLSNDRGLLIKHLNEPGGRLPIAYKNTTVALLVLPEKEPFAGYIRVKSLQDSVADQNGAVHIKNLENPRIFVPEGLMMMYVHLRNEERAGKRPLNRFTFAEHELSPHTSRYRQKDIGKLARFFTANEALRWLEFTRNRTPIEAALQTEFVLGKKNLCAIQYPKQLQEYVTTMCNSLKLDPRPQFGADEVFDVSSDDDEDDNGTTNSEDSSDEDTKMVASEFALQSASGILCMIERTFSLIKFLKSNVFNRSQCTRRHGCSVTGMARRCQAKQI